MPKKQKIRKLSYKELRWQCDPKLFGKKTTADIEPLGAILGQTRALESLKVGLSIKSAGYNIYVAGIPGTGRITTVKSMLEKLEKKAPTPPDILYVNNFKDPTSPRLIKLPAGKGKLLKKEMDELVQELKRAIPAVLESDEFKKKRDEVIEESKGRQAELFTKLDSEIKKEGFALVQIKMGPLTKPALFPIVSGEPTSMEDVEASVQRGEFSKEKYEELKQKHTHLKSMLEDVTKKMRQIEREIREALKDIEQKFLLSVVGSLIQEIKENFSDPKVAEYLDEVKNDVLENSSRFLAQEEMPVQLPIPFQMPRKEDFSVYDVNVIVDNSELKGQPVVIEHTPTYKNLFGVIERSWEPSGRYISDFTMIRAGSLLKANGGFLVINLIDAITEPGVWKALKRTLRNRLFELESWDPFYFFSSFAIKPESIPVDVKVVGIGDNMLYFLLYEMDEEFQKIFKVKADFDSEMEKNSDQIKRYSAFVCRLCRDEKLLDFDSTALAKIVEEGVRIAGSQKKMSTRFSVIADIVRESDYWAKSEGAKVVLDSHVQKALEHRDYRLSLIRDKIQERIADNQILIDTDGTVIGQVNGLAIYMLAGFTFGRPSRITARISMGQAGVVNIDREAKLSGRIHDKAVLILSGYLRSQFAKDKPLSISATVCFEQSYSGVEGDSASLAELLALLSSIVEIPMRQDIAVTGSVNQRGQVQAVGGINEKIEGFFDVCKQRKLTGKQGVIIPESNRGDLMLRPDVIEAVKNKKFEIYVVSSVDEAIEILSGLPAGERDSKGKFPVDSFNGKVDARLRELALELKKFGKPPEESKKKEDSN